jgi:hypothetical protein
MTVVCEPRSMSVAGACFALVLHGQPALHRDAVEAGEHESRFSEASGPVGESPRQLYERQRATPPVTTSLRSGRIASSAAMLIAFVTIVRPSRAMIARHPGARCADVDVALADPVTQRLR